MFRLDQPELRAAAQPRGKLLLRGTLVPNNYYLEVDTMTDKEPVPDSTGQKQDTRFKPGQSGNPSGRPKGARNETRSRDDITQVAKRYEPTPEERAAVMAFFDRRKKAAPCPPLKVSEEDGVHGIAIGHVNPETGFFLLLQALGTSDNAFYKSLVCQLANVGPKGSSATDGLNFMLSVIKAVEPTSELESLLAEQMAAVHVAMMHMATRLSCSTNLKQQESAERAMNKLARTFTTQLEALKRYRTGGEQKVTVEHVHVHEGGQAIVGHMEAGRGLKQEAHG